MARYTNTLNTILLSAVAGSTVVPVIAEARLISCWTNDNGIRECGASVPPEHSQKRIEIVNERGLVVKVIPAAKTKEQLAEEREAARIQQELEEQRKEQARQDTILLNAYTTERDLILARDNNLKAIEGQIEISRGNLRVLKDNLNQLQKEAANFERSGKKPPEKLLKNIEETKAQIQTKQNYLDIKQKEKDEMQARFDRDLKRFRELKHE
jgi:hypothetical protein